MPRLSWRAAACFCCCQNTCWKEPLGNRFHHFLFFIFHHLPQVSCQGLIQGNPPLLYQLFHLHLKALELLLCKAVLAVELLQAIPLFGRCQIPVVGVTTRLNTGCPAGCALVLAMGENVQRFPVVNALPTFIPGIAVNS